MHGGRLGSYEVIERIGEGGMGVVFRARDVRLEREVALKVLPEELARDPQCRARLLREARTVARLSHSNIATCFDVGEARPEPLDLLAPGTPGPHPDSLLFIAMEFVPGEDLTAIVRGKPLSLRRVLDLAVQIASGLEAAHVSGVVHRDMKPGNIRVTPDGRAKILDFGLARACRPAGASSAEITASTTSSAGHIAGTVLYMAPEQAAGEAVDARSDLFSFGIVLYELVTGQRPFGGDDMVSAFYALANEQPPPLARFARGVPGELQRIVDKLLEKRPEHRFQSAHEVLTDLRRVQDTLAPSSGGMRVVPARRKALPWVAAFLAVLAAASFWLRSHPVAKDVPSLAVLEFENATGDSSLKYLCAGLASDIVGDLVQQGHLNVASMAEAARLSGDQRTPKGAARALGVRSILTGALRRLGPSTRLEVELVEGRTAYVRWSAAYDLAAAGAFEVKDQIAKSVASRLGVGGVPRTAAVRFAPPAEAYEEYLRGIEAMTDVDDPLAPGRSVASFARAVTLAPDFALGWAARARALAWGYEHERRPALMTEAERCADEALRLEPNLVEGHVARARIYRETSRLKEAVDELDAALSINPSWDDAWGNLGGLYRQLGDFPRAEASFRRAVDLRPGSMRNWTNLANFLVGNGRNEEARAAYEKVIELGPDRNRGYEGVATVYLLEGKFRDAIAVYEKMPRAVSSAPLASNLASAYFFVGQLDQALNAYLLAVSIEPRDAILRANLGDCYQRMRRGDEASFQYREALNLDDADLEVSPTDPALRARHIMHLAKAGECGKAQTEYAAYARSFSDQDAEIQHVLAKGFAVCGRRAEAIAALKRIIALGSTADLFRSEDEFASLQTDSAYRALFARPKR